MTDVPIYVRARDADDLTTKRPQFVYEGVCPVHSQKDLTGLCWHGESCSGTGPDCDPGEYIVKVICQVTSNTNESIIWCDDDCREMQEWSQLKKCFAAMGTRFGRVWQDTGIPNMATGQVESDPKKFAEHLRVASREMEERLGMSVDYQPCDPADTFHSDEGLDATHDRAVAEGRKDSRGRFVWTV